MKQDIHTLTRAPAQSLERLMNQGQLWRNTGAQCKQELSTGFNALDACLPYGGWPTDAISEVISPQPGLGDMALVLPALARLTQQEGVVACIAPPWLLHSPFLAAQGVNLARLLCIPEPAGVRDKRQWQKRHWAAEQIVKSGSCNGLLYWQAKPLPFIAYRRLQMLCGQFGCPAFMFHQSAPLNSPSSVRLQVLARKPASLNIKILKMRGAWAQHQLALPVDEGHYYRYELA